MAQGPTEEGTLTMLSEEEALMLRRAGFVRAEIMAFGAAVAPDGTPQRINLNSSTWQAAIASRREWVSKMRRRGWTVQRIAAEINWWYTSKLATSPFAFIQAEYKRPGRIADYQAARQARARQRTQLMYARVRRAHGQRQ